jgi:hypothetical protein
MYLIFDSAKANYLRLHAKACGFYPLVLSPFDPQPHEHPSSLRLIESIAT